MRKSVFNKKNNKQQASAKFKTNSKGVRTWMGVKFRGVVFYGKRIIGSWILLSIGYIPHVLTISFVGTVINSAKLSSADLFSLQQSITFWNTFSAIAFMASILIIIFKINWRLPKQDKA